MTTEVVNSVIMEVVLAHVAETIRSKFHLSALCIAGNFIHFVMC